MQRSLGIAVTHVIRDKARNGALLYFIIVSNYIIKLNLKIAYTISLYCGDITAPISAFLLAYT